MQFLRLARSLPPKKCRIQRRFHLTGVYLTCKNETHQFRCGCFLGNVALGGRWSSPGIGVTQLQVPKKDPRHKASARSSCSPATIQPHTEAEPSPQDYPVEDRQVQSDDEGFGGVRGKTAPVPHVGSKCAPWTKRPLKERWIICQ